MVSGAETLAIDSSPRHLASCHEYAVMAKFAELPLLSSTSIASWLMRATKEPRIQHRHASSPNYQHPVRETPYECKNCLKVSNSICCVLAPMTLSNSASNVSCEIAQQRNTLQFTYNLHLVLHRTLTISLPYRAEDEKDSVLLRSSSLTCKLRSLSKCVKCVCL